jgi:hypothetical protein
MLNILIARASLIMLVASRKNNYKTVPFMYEARARFPNPRTYKMAFFY